MNAKKPHGLTGKPSNRQRNDVAAKKNLNIRVTEEEKQLIDSAAEAKGVTASDFIRSVLIRAAKRILN